MWPPKIPSLPPSLFLIFIGVGSMLWLASGPAGEMLRSAGVYAPDRIRAPRPARPMTEKSATTAGHEQRTQHAGSKIWVAMSLCFGENVDMGEREKKPYAAAAEFATRLWPNQTDGHIQVVMTIVQNGGQNSPELDSYVDRLRSYGARVILQRNQIDNCVLQAQTIRLFTFEADFIHEDDVIMLFDVDGFPSGQQILRVLQQPYRAWVLEYIHVQTTGETVPMAGTAMRKSDWRQALNFSHMGLTTDSIAMIRHFASIPNTYMWGIDQKILSLALLNPHHQMCSLHKDNHLWKGLGLEPHEFDDKDFCFHGNMMNCWGSMSKARMKSCSWWHFLPSAGLQDFQEAFEIITSHHEH